MEPIPIIRFITRKWPPAVGGMETYSVQLSKELQSRASVQVWCLRGRANGRPPSPLALLVFGLVTALRILFSRTAVDVVHVGDMASWPLGWISKWKAPATRVALAAHGTDVAYPRRASQLAWLYRQYLELGAKWLSGAVVVANSSATASEAQRHGYSNVSVVPLATNFRRASAPCTPQCHLLFAGRLVPRKGFSWFVGNVLPHLPAEIEVRVAGPVWSDSEAQALRNPRVRFLGPLAPNVLAVEYASALCVVCPNIDVPSGEIEGFGMVATEAAAAGGVALAARHSGLVEAVIDGVTGFLVAPGNVDAWIEAVLRVRNWSPEERQSFIQRAVGACAEHYSWSRVAADTLNAYVLAK